MGSSISQNIKIESIEDDIPIEEDISIEDNIPMRYGTLRDPQNRISRLPVDLQEIILNKVDISKLDDFCRTNEDIMALCENIRVMDDYLEKYHIKMNIPIDTDKLLYMLDYIDNIIPIKSITLLKYAFKKINEFPEATESMVIFLDLILRSGNYNEDDLLQILPFLPINASIGRVLTRYASKYRSVNILNWLADNNILDTRELLIGAIETHNNELVRITLPKLMATYTDFQLGHAIVTFLDFANKADNCNAIKIIYNLTQQPKDFWIEMIDRFTGQLSYERNLRGELHTRNVIMCINQLVYGNPEYF